MKYTIDTLSPMLLYLTLVSSAEARKIIDPCSGNAAVLVNIHRSLIIYSEISRGCFDPN